MRASSICRVRSAHILPTFVLDSRPSHGSRAEMTSNGRISQGAVRERSPGHWEVRIPAGVTGNGRRDVYQETLPTKRAAVVRRDELLAKRRQTLIRTCVMS